MRDAFCCETGSLLTKQVGTSVGLGAQTPESGVMCGGLPWATNPKERRAPTQELDRCRVTFEHSRRPQVLACRSLLGVRVRRRDFLRYTLEVLEVAGETSSGIPTLCWRSWCLAVVRWWFSRSRRFSCQVGCGVVLGLWTCLRLKAVSHSARARHVDCACCDTVCPFPDTVGSDSGLVLPPYWHNEISVERKTLGNKSAHSHDLGSRRKSRTAGCRYDLPGVDGQFAVCSVGRPFATAGSHSSVRMRVCL